MTSSIFHIASKLKLNEKTEQFENKSSIQLIQQYNYKTITFALTSKDHFRHNQQQEEKRQKVVTASTKQKPTTQIYI